MKEVNRERRNNTYSYDIFISQTRFGREAGRFIRRTTMGKGGRVNLYEFVRNNPIEQIHPEGKNPYFIVKGILYMLKDQFVPYDSLKQMKGIEINDKY